MNLNVIVCLASCLASSAACAAPVCNLAEAPAVPVIKGLPYDQARAALLGAGWLPGHGSRFVDMAGNQSVFHDRGYGELVSCDFGRGEACHFEFTSKPGIRLRVVTSGEENQLLDSQAIVSGAELGCPN